MIKNTKHVTTNYPRIRNLEWYNSKMFEYSDIPNDEWIITEENIKSHDIALYIDHKKANIKFITNKKRILNKNESYYNHKEILNNISPDYKSIIDNIDKIYPDIKYKTVVIFGKIYEDKEDVFTVNDIALLQYPRPVSKSKDMKSDIMLFKLMKEDNIDNEQFNYINDCILSLEGRINAPFRYMISYNNIIEILKDSKLNTSNIVYRNEDFNNVIEYDYKFDKHINNIIIRPFNNVHYFKNSNRMIFKKVNPIYNEKLIKANRINKSKNKLDNYSDIVASLIIKTRDELTNKDTFKNVLKDYTQKDFEELYYLPVKIMSQHILKVLNETESDKIEKIKILNEYNILKKLIHNIVLYKYMDADYVYKIYCASDKIEKDESKKINKESVLDCIEDDGNLIDFNRSNNTTAVQEIHLEGLEELIKKGADIPLAVPTQINIDPLLKSLNTTIEVETKEVNNTDSITTETDTVNDSNTDTEEIVIEIGRKTPGFSHGDIRPLK